MNNIVSQRTAFFVSDRTGITAETMGLSLISQFEPQIHFKRITLPFIDTLEKANEAKERIHQAKVSDQTQPIVFGTIINDEVRKVITSSDAYFIDFFGTFIAPLETKLNMASSHSVGKIHGVKDPAIYNTRIEALNFALNFDDGARTHGYESADLILVGVSRCGKTPTSIYLAMQYGIRAANYPITEDEFKGDGLPDVLKNHRKKLYGLTIEAERLHTLRLGRRPNSSYSDLKQCQKETLAVENLFKREHIPYINSTNLSIEELATKLLVLSGIERRLQ